MGYGKSVREHHYVLKTLKLQCAGMPLYVGLTVSIIPHPTHFLKLDAGKKKEVVNKVFGTTQNA